MHTDKIGPKQSTCSHENNYLNLDSSVSDFIYQRHDALTELIQKHCNGNARFMKVSAAQACIASLPEDCSF